jgi:hypothetical protein
MRWTYRFRIQAPLDTIYQVGFAPDKWFTFYPGYRGRESVDTDWPAEGSSILIRYAILGPWSLRLKQTIVEHEQGHRLRMHEEALSGWWIDTPEFTFEPQGDSTEVTLSVDPTSKWLLGRVLIWLIFWPFTLITPRAMKRFKAMIEHSRA